MEHIMWWVGGGFVAAYMAMAILLEEKLHVYDSLGSHVEGWGETICFYFFLPGAFVYLLACYFARRVR